MTTIDFLARFVAVRIAASLNIILQSTWLPSQTGLRPSTLDPYGSELHFKPSNAIA